MINNKFLRFKNREVFEEYKKNDEISSSSIVFIEGPTEKDKAIYSNGIYYTGYSSEKSKGFYETFEDLVEAWPNPEVGDWAIIAKKLDSWTFGDQMPVILTEPVFNNWYVCMCEKAGTWYITKYSYSKEKVNLNQYLKKDDDCIQQLRSDIANIKAVLNID